MLFSPAVALAGFLLPLPAAPASPQAGFVHWESPHVHPLERTPDGQRLLAVNTPDARLEVFELSSGTPVRAQSIPVGLEPVTVRARSANEAWVVNHVSDSISIVDLASGHVVATLATDDEPCDVVFASSPTAPFQRAFVSCSQPSTLLVYDVDALSTPPVRLALSGKEPRALAYDAARGEVVVAFAEAGNGTTILAGKLSTGRVYPPKATLNPLGPYGGVTPPPNAGASFDPPLNPANGAAPLTGLIVRRNALGEWRDVNAADWTAFVSGPGAVFSGRKPGWTLLDHDLAFVDAETLAVRYEGELMNLVMAVGVNPSSGEVTALGTDATNEVRFEPNLAGTFLRVRLARVEPAPGGAKTLVDLNPQLDYSAATVAPATRALGLGDPRALEWHPSGAFAFVAGMGSNNVLVVDASGARLGAPLPVGSGPTGLSLDVARGQLYVLNKFEASLSVLSSTSGAELARVPFFDPSPTAVKRGRRHLYDTHATSGTGIVACASCHVDARTDRLAWDLGDPSGTEQPLGEQVVQNGGTALPFHPLKGPLLTQTLQDIVGKEPFHWRGDRDGLEAFNPAFESLLGDDAQLSPAEMQEFEDFLATVWLPPNPFRALDNSLPTSLPLPGHFSTGELAPAGQPLPNGNAATGRAFFRPPFLRDFEGACSSCHALPASLGSGAYESGAGFVEPPLGPNGERHHALIQFQGEVFKVPQLRTLHERTGFDATQLESVAGFGYVHNGSVDSLARFVSDPSFGLTSLQEVADMVAFLLCLSGELEPPGPPTSVPYEPPSPPTKSVHAAVGAQVTLLTATPPPAEAARLAQLVGLAEGGAVGLVAHGKKDGLARGFAWRGPDLWQSDRLLETFTSAQLVALAASGSELTFTAVPRRSERRLGLDRDLDGAYDRDELDLGTDPADRELPKARGVPSGRRP